LQAKKCFHSFDPDFKNPSFMKAIITGGGPGGLATALALSNIGIDATLYEAAPSFKPVGAGLALAPNAIKALKALGVEDKVTANAEIPSKTYIKTHTGEVIAETNNKEVFDRYGAQGITIHRAELNDILLSQLDASKVIAGKRVKGFYQDKNKVTVTFEDGSSDTADMLIAADGIHSVVRRSFLPQSKERYSGQTCWRGITRINEKIEYFSESWGPDSRFGIVPLKDGSVYWFAVANAPQNDPAMKALTKKELVKMFEGFHDPVAKLIESTGESSIHHNDLIDLEPIRQYAFGNIVLVGDAAHATTPNLGQGACMAIEDAVVLANCLKSFTDPAEAFKEFERKRIKRTTRIVETSWKVGKLSRVSNPLMISIRNFMLRNMPRAVANKQSDFLFNVDFN